MHEAVGYIRVILLAIRVYRGCITLTKRICRVV